MRLGDPVVVVDPSSPRLGTWGRFVDLTRGGELVVSFADDEVETMSPFQLESDQALANEAAAVRRGAELDWRKVAKPERVAS